MKYFLVVFFLMHANRSLQAQDSSRHPAPVFISRPITRIANGEIYRYQVRGMDSLGNELHLQVKNLPDWLSFDSSDRTIAGRAKKAGQFPVIIELSSPEHKTLQHFMITVTNTRTTNILCIGNSITNGTSHYNSYRRPLWKMLHAGGYNFDFIGSWDKHHMGGEVPDPDFDMDHEGHSGWTSEHFFHPPSWDSARGNLHEWLQSYRPDIVLIELGTNDVFQCRNVDTIISDLRLLVQELRKRNGQVKIFLAQIPPLGKQWASQKLCGDGLDYDQSIRQLNLALLRTAMQLNNKNGLVTIVDQYAGVNTATDMYDDIHPNEKGEQEMARRWFRAIRPFLNKL